MGRDVVCVNCRQQTVDPTWRPFCSERCKLLDLRNWIDERYRVPGEAESSLREHPDSDADGAPEQ